MSFKDELNGAVSQLVELETSARGLRNQHLADLIGHAVGRLKDAAGHPDVDNVDRVNDGRKEFSPDQAPTRENLDAQLALLPGTYTDPDYVVNGMRAHYGEVFTADDEVKVRDLVKPAPPMFFGNPADPNAPPPPDPGYMPPNAG